MIILTTLAALASYVIYSTFATLLRGLADIPHLAGAVLIEEWDKRTADKKARLEELRQQRKEEKKQKRADAKLLKKQMRKEAKMANKSK